MKSNFYYIEYRDRSDHDPMAVFFVIYNRQTGAVVRESATYYNSKELQQVATRIVSDFENGKAINQPTLRRRAD